MDAFAVETLSLPQIRALYRERMTRDFPPDELKPLAMIEKALARDEYVCYGAVNGGGILAYAYFVMLKENGKPYALFDYYAVRQDIRDRGVGSRFMQALIAGPLREMDCVLLEVDDPDCAKTPEEKNKIIEKAFTSYREPSMYLRDCALNKQIIVVPGAEQIAGELRRIGNNLNQLTREVHAGYVSEINLTETREELKAIWQSLNALLQAAR